MTTRASKRLASRKGRLGGEGAADSTGKARKASRRTSVGRALGLTPKRPKGRNLQEAMAAEVAKAAAVQLDGFSEAEQRVHA